VEVVASLCQGRTAVAQCGLFTHKSVPVIFEPPCTFTFKQIYNSFETKGNGFIFIKTKKKKNQTNKNLNIHIKLF